MVNWRNWQTSLPPCWTDELFHKVAEDYNNIAFQFMQGKS